MLTEICAELRNYFEVPNGRHFGKFTISGGSIAPLDFLQDGQYFRIVGSVFNDGVYQMGSDTQSLKDETFEGAIWAMAVPPSVVALASDIKMFVESDAAKVSPYVSESFGGYTYTRATNTKGVTLAWQDVFAGKLNKWRKARIL